MVDHRNEQHKRPFLGQPTLSHGAVGFDPQPYLGACVLFIPANPSNEHQLAKILFQKHLVAALHSLPNNDRKS